jgi:hypothetical protein
MPAGADICANAGKGEEQEDQHLKVVHWLVPDVREDVAAHRIDGE